MSFSILIAEDDKLILQGLAKTYPWTLEGFDLVDTAINGKRAIEKLQANRYDIVLTDISMPFADGLEVTREAKARNEETEVILFTGFDSFSYAQQAVKLGALDFLLKPVSNSDLHLALEKAKSLIEERRVLHRQRQESLSLLRRDLFQSLMQHPLEKSRTTALGLPWLEGPVRSTIIWFLDYEHVDTDLEESLFSLQDLLQKRLGRTAYIWYEEGRIHLISSEDLHPLLMELLHATDKRLLVTEGEIVPSLTKISSSLHTALSLGERYGFIVQGCIVSPETVHTMHPSRSSLSGLTKALSEALVEGNDASCIAILDSMEECVPVEQQDVIALLLVLQVARLVQPLESQGLLHIPEKLWEQSVTEVRRADSLHTQFLALQRLGKAVTQAITTPMETDPIGTKLLAYVNLHLTDSQLSLAMVGDYMHLSIPYLSSLFRRKSGVSFSEYVIAHRMEKAHTYLLSSTLKINEISKLVGLPNTKYFSARFKEFYGKTPMELRAEGQTRGDEPKA